MRIVLLALAALAAAPARTAEPMCSSTAFAPGFAPGQARLADALTIGPPVALTLRAADATTFAVPPAHAPEAGSHGGTFALIVATAGTYRIALSAKAWIDLVQGGAALVSTEHQMGAPCSGVAKIVAFKLEPGRYDVQISGAPAAGIAAQVMREAVIPVAGARATTQPAPLPPSPKG